MRIYVVGSSALYFWRRCAFAHRLLSSFVPDPLSDCPVSCKQLEEPDLCIERFGPAPLHLMVPDHDLRISKKRYKYSVSNRPYPETAFLQLDESICLASPELCLLQSMKAYPPVRFMELCMEVCGKYSLMKEDPRGFVTRDYPLASLEGIRSLAAQTQSIRGFAQTRVLLQDLAEGSRSPMETRTYLLMCLPKRMGGYGLPKPELNMRISLSKEEQRFAERRYFECDMCWPEAKVVVEYDGHEDHADRYSRNRDSKKRNVLISKGYTVFTITGGQLRDARAFGTIVCEIARLLGYRLQGFPQDWAERRIGLREELFVSMRNSQTTVSSKKALEAC